MQRVAELNGWSDYWNVAAMVTLEGKNFDQIMSICKTFSHNELLVTDQLGSLRKAINRHLDAPFARIITNSQVIFNELKLMARRGNIVCAAILIDCNGEVIAEKRFQDID